MKNHALQKKLTDLFDLAQGYSLFSTTMKNFIMGPGQRLLEEEQSLIDTVDKSKKIIHHL